MEKIISRAETVRLATFPSTETLLVVEVLAKRGRSRALKALPCIRDNPFLSYLPSVSKKIDIHHHRSPVPRSCFLLGTEPISPVQGGILSSKDAILCAGVDQIFGL